MPKVEKAARYTAYFYRRPWIIIAQLRVKTTRYMVCNSRAAMREKLKDFKATYPHATILFADKLKW